MNKIYLLLCAFSITAFSANAQVVYTFEDLSVLPDSFISADNFDGSFGDTLVQFQSTWDTAWGGFWKAGFAPSRKQDKVTAGFTNQYSAITGSGFSSNTYAVFFEKGGIKLSNDATGKAVKGFYITNTTYAYLSMRDGDAFAKKFGGDDGDDADYFYLTIKGYLNGVEKADSVNFYLADFRNSDNAQDYILDDWAWIDLLSLGGVDSLSFQLSSSDVGAYGINTPQYFAMDNFTFYDETTTIAPLLNLSAKAYPNPVIASQNFNIVLSEEKDFSIYISNINGAIIKTENYKASSHANIPTEGMISGIYFATIQSEGKSKTIRFNVQ